MAGRIVLLTCLFTLLVLLIEITGWWSKDGPKLVDGLCTPYDALELRF